MKAIKILLIFFLFAETSFSQAPNICMEKIKPVSSLTLNTFAVNHINHADFNNDGNIDLLIRTNKWYLYQGNGNGTFTKKDSISFSMTGNTKLKDLTNDGLPDIVFDDWYSINLGNFSFSTPQNFLGSSATTFSDVYDFNNDGYNDIAAVRFNTVMSVCINNQIGGFNTPITTTITGAPSFNLLDLKVTDFDKDGMKDIVLCGAPNIGFLKRTGPTTFNNFVAVSTASASKVKLADFNNDGYEDMIMSSYSTKDFIYFMSNGVNFTKNTFSLRNNLYNSSGAASIVALAEINNDGFIDVITHNGSTNQGSMELAMVKNNGNGTFGFMGVYKAFDYPVCIDAFDANNDLKPDVILCQDNNPFYNINTCLNLGNGNLNFPKSYAYGNFAADNVVIDDFDNDLDKEAILLSQYSGKGMPFIIDDNNKTNDTSFFDSAIMDSSNIFGHQMEKGDFNKDGLLDIAYTSILNNRIGILLNKGNLQFTQPFYIYLPAKPSAITVGDFNSDANLDIAVCYTNSAVFTALLNTGGLSFTQVNTTSMASKNNGIAASDFNNDGRTDIALIEDFNLRIYTGNNTGNFTLINSYPTFPDGLERIRVADLNSDVNKDLVVCMKFSGKILTCFGSGTGTFSNSSYNVFGLPQWTAHADLNSDGIIDIVTANGSSSTSSSYFSILFGQGSNSFWPAQNFYQPEGLVGVEIGDLNNDGSQQIVFSGRWGATVYNTAGAFFNYKSPYTLCSGQTLTLTAPSIGAGTSYTWMPGNITTNSLVVTGSGSYYLNYSNSTLGCNAKSNTITVNAISATPSNITINGGPRTICGGDSVKLNVTTALKPTWNTGDTTLNIIKFPFGNVIYQVNAIDSNGCNIMDTFTVKVNPLPLITFSLSANTVCSGSLVTITAYGANSYTWSTGSNSNSITPTPTLATSYSVAGTNSLGCSSNNSITVNTKPIPSVTVVANNYTVCAGSNATLTASGANTYSWSVSPNSNPKVVTPTVTTTYTVWGTSTLSCTGTQTVTINTNPKPTLSITSTPSAICFGQTATITVTGANTYTWVVPSASGPSITVSPLSNTTYFGNATDLNGCTNSFNYNLNVNTCTGLNNQVINNSIYCYPNPTSGELILRTGHKENLELEVYNVIGEMILKQAIIKTETSINLKEKANGVYFVRLIENGNTVYYSKIVKQ